MITLKDIANALNVAPSTVTRALADDPRISPKTAKRVKAKAAELGYIANSAAKLMQGQESTLIGLLVPDIENVFYAAVAKGVAEVCNAHHFQLVLAVSNDEPDIEERHIRELIGARCAGILIVPTATPTQQSLMLLATKKTAQLIRHHKDLNADWYGIDDAGAIQTAVNYLFDLGHRRIGLICGDKSLSSGEERYQGYISAHQARHMTIDPQLIVRGSPSTSTGETGANKLNALSAPVSAIIAAGAGLTEGMLSAVSTWKSNRREFISLIGYSECNAFRWWGGTGLTTIDLPVRQIATDVCTALLDRIKTKTKNALPIRRVYNSHLLLRGSARPHIQP